MDPAITVRRLVPADVAMLRALNGLFGRAFDGPDSYARASPDDAYLSTLLAKEHVVVLVAEMQGQVIGGLVAYDLEKFERARRELYIYDLAVDEGHRRRGIATALISYLQRLGAQRGAWVIYVQADYGDNAAIALYSGLGRREDVMHFDIPVAGPSTDPH